MLTRRLAAALLVALINGCVPVPDRGPAGSVPTPTIAIGPSPSVGAPAAADRAIDLWRPSPSVAAVAADTQRRPPPRSLPALHEGVVPILYYHRVQAVPRGFRKWSRARKREFLTYDTLPSAFVAQLDWLHDHGYTTILPRQLAAHWDHGTPLPRRPVILTFDDGSPSWVSVVLPALRARGMVAEFYLTLDAIRAKTIRWSQVRALAAAGNGIGAHDVHHVQLVGVPGRRDASRRVMWHEIHDIRAVIQQHVGVAPDSMAYVGGGFDRALVDLVRRAGYTTARSIRRGIHQRPAARFQLGVVRVGSRDDVADIVSGTLVGSLPTFTRRMAGTLR
jgi:peptidoglycan/xylan/chitin deacetylase (PgdA/CDA1 family)